MTPEQILEWDNIRVPLMRELLQHKFEQCEEFSSMLKPNELYVETTSDEFWGCGHMEHQARRIDYIKLPGQNVMGSLLNELARCQSLALPRPQHL